MVKSQELDESNASGPLAEYEPSLTVAVKSWGFVAPLFPRAQDAPLSINRLSIEEFSQVFCSGIIYLFNCMRIFFIMLHEKIGYEI